MRRVFVWLSAVILLGCAEEVAPVSDVSGAWTARHVESSILLRLVETGREVTGTGTYFRFVNPPSGTLTATGSYTAPRLSLTFTYDTGVLTQYVGTVHGADSIVGVETFPGGTTDSLVFARRDPAGATAADRVASRSP
jgi:hypothetical protein